MVVDLLTGVRVASMLMWILVWLRFSVLQIPIENRSGDEHKKADRLWRLQNTLMAFSIACLFGPENILRVRGYISPDTGYAMLSAGAAIGIVCAIILLCMKDVLEARHPRAVFGYIALPIVIIVYMIG